MQGINVHSVKVFDGETSSVYECFLNNVESIIIHFDERITCEIEFEDGTRKKYMERYIVSYEE